MSEPIKYTSSWEPKPPFVALVAPEADRDKFKAALFPLGTLEPTPCTFIDGMEDGGFAEFMAKIDATASSSFEVQPEDIVWSGGGPRSPLLGERAVTTLLAFIRTGFLAVTVAPAPEELASLAALDSGSEALPPGS